MVEEALIVKIETRKSRVSAMGREMRLCVAVGVTFVFSAALATAPILASASSFDRAGFVRVGHEPIAPDPTIRRYTGMVAALGPPDAQGKRYAFKPSPVGPRNFPLSSNDLRGWRMTMLSGKRFGEVFRVGGNTESEITITADSGPIDGLELRDLFVIESIDADGASMFAPAAGPGGVPAPGV